MAARKCPQKSHQFALLPCRCLSGGSAELKVKKKDIWTCQDLLDVLLARAQIWVGLPRPHALESASTPQVFHKSQNAAEESLSFDCGLRLFIFVEPASQVISGCFTQEATIFRATAENR